jgi:Tfp pilus assembly protein FimT
VREAGFSFVELIVVVALITTISGAAIFGVQTALVSIRGASGGNRLIAELRNAREWALAQRRSVEVQFVGSNEIRLIRQDLPTGTTTLTTVFFEQGVQLQRFEGMPDTPDQLPGAGANGTAVDFGGAASLTFISDGTFVDETGTPVSGTIFVGRPNEPTSARAVTVFGGTGRVREYRWDGSQWVG